MPVTELNHYLIRANALEDNFRLYYYDQGRRMLTTAAVKPPAASAPVRSKKPRRFILAPSPSRVIRRISGHYLAATGVASGFPFSTT